MNDTPRLSAEDIQARAAALFQLVTTNDTSVLTPFQDNKHPCKEDLDSILNQTITLLEAPEESE